MGKKSGHLGKSYIFGQNRMFFTKKEGARMTETEWMRRFSNNLYELIKDGYLTQDELSELIGYSQPTISRWLNMVQAPSIFAVINLSYALDIDYEQLIDFGEMVKQ